MYQTSKTKHFGIAKILAFIGLITAFSANHCSRLYPQDNIEPTSEIISKVYEVSKWGSILQYRLSKQIEGFSTSSRISIKNETSDTWGGLEAKGSCGCVAITRLDSTVVPPGGILDFEFSITPSPERSFKQQIDVQARNNGGQAKKQLFAIQISSAVSPPVEVSPKVFRMQDLIDGKCKIKIRSGMQERISIDWASVHTTSDDISIGFDKNNSHETLLIRECKLGLKNIELADASKDLRSGIDVAFRMKGSEEIFRYVVPLEFLSDSPVRIIPKSFYIEADGPVFQQELSRSFAITDKRGRDRVIDPTAIFVRLVQMEGETRIKVSDIKNVKIAKRSEQFLTGSVELPADLPGAIGNDKAVFYLEMYEETGSTEPELLGKIALLRK